MAKPTPRRIPSDDCAVSVDGQIYYPHEGEWVELYVGMSVGEWQQFERIRRLGVDLLAIQGEQNEAAQTLKLLDQHFDDLCQKLARRVVDWNWTDDREQPLPKPDGTSGPLKGLRSEELNWLLTAGQGETPVQRKNGLRPSQTIASATA